jgi:riboflavin kinase/FMN adenylyltransferase
MKIFKSLDDFSQDLRGSTIVIGNFDGVHKGHQILLAQAEVAAYECGGKRGVLTFEPHPRHLFRPDEPPGRITPADFKLELLKSFGIDFVVVLPFDWNFASQSAEAFIQNILIDALGAAHIVVGVDFRFGQLRKGDPAMIEAAGLAVSVVDKFGGYSSSDVRHALRHGDMATANEILGWEWEVRGIIVQGDQRGRELGYPTANVKLGDTIHPSYGIYAAWVQIEGEHEWRKAAVNVGIRPMFEIAVAQVEAHILDFDGDIYGRELRVRLVKRLRGEAKFDSLGALIAQMDKDCAQARGVLEA